MKKFSMGHGAAEGLHGAKARRAYRWLWRSWLEAQSEVPQLRWLAAAAVLCAAGIFALAVMEGKGALEVLAYGATAFLFILVIPAIGYLLFEVYRHHRSDAIFSSRRLEDTIRQVAQEEILAHEVAKIATGEQLLYMRTDQAAAHGKRS